MNKICLTCCLLFAALITRGQNTSIIDSLNGVITVARHDSQVAEAYLLLGEQFYQTNLDTAGLLWEKARVIAVEGRNNPDATPNEERAFSRILGTALNNMGYFYGMSGDQEKAIEISEQSLELYRLIGDRSGEASALINSGAMHIKLGRVELGLSYYLESLQIRIGLDEKAELASTYNNIGATYNNLGDAEKAFTNYHKALAICEELQDTGSIANTLNNIGYVHILQNDTAQGMHFYRRAYEMFVAADIEGGIAMTLNNMGAEYCNQGKIEQCLDCYRESLKINEKISNWQTVGTIYNNIGNLYEGLVDLDSAYHYYNKALDVQQRFNQGIGLIYSQVNIASVLFQQEQFRASEEYALKAYAQAVKMQHAAGKKRCAEMLTVLYRERGDFQAAFRYYKEFVAIRDSLNSEKNQRASIRQQMQYEYEKQAVADSVSMARERALGEARDKANQAALAEERLWTSSLIVGSVLLVIILGLTVVAIISQRRSQAVLKRQRDNIQKSEKEKELLLREIHHRVKNNLQIITGLLELQSVEMDDERFASAIVEGQNRVKSMALIHQKLYQVDELATINIDDYVQSLIRELEVVFRTDKRVKHVVECNGIMLDIDTAIPLGLMLNELISNSYKYAVNYTERPEICIKIAQLAEGEFALHYQDNGPGLPADFSFKSTTLGMRLVKRLAQQLFGSVDIDQDHMGAKFEIRFKDNSFRNQID